MFSKISKPQLLRLKLLPIAVSLVTLAPVTAVQAESSFLNAWQSRYPSSLSDENVAASGRDCTLCHDPDSRSRLNAYGWDYMQSGRNFAAIENLDSDNDPTGSTNLEEINLNTQPGWTTGATNEIYNFSSLLTSAALPPSGVAGDLDPADGNQPPTADANGPYTGTEGIPVAFDGSGSNDLDGNIVAYDWDFGDGSTGTGQSPTHTYAGTGTFDVELVVTDDAGDTDSAMTTATIGVGNQAPVADANGPYSGTVNVAVSFDGSGSNDPDGSIVSYDWDFGDGSSGSGATPSHAYGSPGTYNVALTVTDDQGVTDSANSTATIDAGNQAPIADAGGTYSGTVGVALGFDGSGSNDPDGSIVSYDWDFGDGNSATGSNPSHSYAAVGNYNVTLTVTDDEGASNQDTTTANIGAVDNASPVADANGPYNGTVGEPVSFDGTGSTDSDGSIVAYDWDFGDGSAGTGPTPTHTYATDGTYNVTLTVTDNSNAGDSATTTATIGVGNQAPVADANGPYSGTVGLPVEFDGTGSSDDGDILAYDWDFGDGTTGTGPTPAHTYDVADTYNVTLTVTDDMGVADSAGTTVTVAPVVTGADVYLSELWAVDSKKIRVGKKKSMQIIAVGDGTVAQGATATLAVMAPSEGIRVTVKRESVSKQVKPGKRLTKFKFKADIVCLQTGDYPLQWTATVTADQNANPGNDTVSGETTVSCKKGRVKDDDRDDDHDDDREDDDHEDDDDHDD
jgi:PKD repeat protein